MCGRVTTSGRVLALRFDTFMASSLATSPSNGPLPGTVYLVGAGPGDPGLLTVRASELLAGATVVYHDNLVSRAVLSRCGPDARLVDVGKVGHGPCTAQRAIEQQLVASARAGQRVVRLKGGDPLLFGRGAEEALALVAAGIPFEIVPGVSSALAAPAYAGIPLTMRGVAASVAIVTGHSTSGAPAYIPAADTIVVMMGIANAAAIRDQLLSTGHAPDVPTAVIEWGTCEAQRVVTGTLESLPDLIAREALGAPALLVIGDVVRLREQLDWQEKAARPIATTDK
jgi:uroporphyrin-III C-methyltransferase